jgi:hypothetical protein
VLNSARSSNDWIMTDGSWRWMISRPRLPERRPSSEPILRKRRPNRGSLPAHLPWVHVTIEPETTYARMKLLASAMIVVDGTNASARSRVGSEEVGVLLDHLPGRRAVGGTGPPGVVYTYAPGRGSNPIELSFRALQSSAATFRPASTGASVLRVTRPSSMHRCFSSRTRVNRPGARPRIAEFSISPTPTRMARSPGKLSPTL